MTLKVAWRPGAGALRMLAADYRRLIASSPHTTLFNEWFWIDAAATYCVPAGRQIRTLTVHRGEQLVACLPMTCGRETILGLRVRTLRALGHPLSDRFGLPMADDSPDVLATIIDALTDPKLSEADVTILSEVSATAENHARYAEASPARPPHIQVCARAPVLDVSDPVRLNAGLSKGLKTRVVRARKKLKASGTTQFQRLRPPPPDVPALLKTLASIEGKSWKGVAGVGIFSTPERFAFFESVACALAAEGRLEILLFSLNDEVVSYRFGFRSGTTFLDYNFAHPLELDSLSVGRVLLAEAIESASAAGLSTFDASRGSLTKPNILHDWSDECIEHDDVWFFARSVWGDLLRLAVVKAKPFVKRVMRREEMA